MRRSGGCAPSSACRSRTGSRAIAACESGGDPAAVGGGGLYRGKYQFDRRTWRSVGGAGDPRRGARGRAGRAGGAPVPARQAPRRGPPAAAEPLLCARMDAEPCARSSRCSSEIAYLNSGTDGPLPAAAVEAGARGAGRAGARRARPRRTSSAASRCRTSLRGPTPRLVGAPADEIALTTSTTDGLGRVIAGLGPRRRATRSSPPTRSTPACSARCWRRAGAASRCARSRSRTCAEAVGPDTTLVALSHVSWVGGEVAPAALAELDVPGDPRRRAGRGRDPRRPARARLRRLRGRRARSGSAARTAPASCGWTPRSRSGSSWSAPGYMSFADVVRRPRGRLQATRSRATTRRRSRARRSRCRSRAIELLESARLGRGPRARRRARAPARRRAARARPDA